jgi:guanylate cyclase
MKILTQASLDIKIGIHYGNCIFGVLGYHKPQFSLIGDTVNTTSRHCTTGPGGKVILSEQAHAALDKYNELEDYKFMIRMAAMKGKG